MSFLEKVTTVSDCITKVSIFALLIITLFFVSNVYSQPKLGKRVYGDKSGSENNKSNVKQNNFVPQKSTEYKKKDVVLTKSRTEKKVPRGRATRQVNQKNIFQTQKPVQVTFIGKEPFVEVWLNDKNVGATDMESRFVKNLAPGEYRLMAKVNRTVFLPTRRVKISAENNQINLFLETKTVPKSEPTGETTVNKTVEESKNELQLAIEISDRAKKILEAYGNPETTDSVTTEDWEFVYRTANLGQFQDYTAVQTEAQRWFASGQIELSKKQYVNALTAFKKAQEFTPTSALLFYGSGNTYLANKQYADAVSMYQRALRLDPKLSMAYKKLGDSQRLLNKDKEAIVAYKNAIQNGYKTAETRYQLASLMLENKQIEEALPVLEEIAKEMQKADVYITIGSGYEKLKRDVSAIENFLKAIELDPNMAIAYYKLANVYYNQRENGKAKEAFEKALALDPEGKSFNRSEAQKKLREASKQNK